MADWILIFVACYKNQKIVYHPVINSVL